MPKGKSAYSNSKARVLALQALYEVDVASHPVDASFNWLTEEAELPRESSVYALELMEGVIRQREQIDESIHKFAPAWPVKQLAVVDRNILRLALFEIRFGRDVPRKVAINEAVELAKTFGSESSPRFVNGVLGSLMDEMESNQEGSAEPAAAAIDNISQKEK